MYGILPLEAQNLGIALPLVGLLLSANRLVRLISNTWASTIFERSEPYWPFVVVTILGLLTTMMYGLGWGFVIFLIARLGWGIAWSGLRQGAYQAIWTAKKERRGQLTGLLWGIVRLGSAISVILGGYLRDNYGYRAAIGGISLLSAIAIPFSLRLRWPQQARIEQGPQASNQSAPKNLTTNTQNQTENQAHRDRWWLTWSRMLKIARQRWLLASGFLEHTFANLLASTAALFLAQQMGEQSIFPEFGLGVGTIAGFMLSVRWMSDLMLGPLFGILADRLGYALTIVLLTGLSLLGTLGVVTLGTLGSLLCLTLVFILGSGLYVALNTAVSIVSQNTDRPHLFVGAFSTTTDAGSALGPLIAYSVSGIISLETVYLIAGGLLLIAVSQYWFSEG